MEVEVLMVGGGGWERYCRMPTTAALHSSVHVCRDHPLNGGIDGWHMNSDDCLYIKREP